MNWRTRIADRLMPWVAGNASAWPSMAATHSELLAQVREAEDTLREVGRLLDRSTQTGKAPTGDEWRALGIVNDALDGRR